MGEWGETKTKAKANAIPEYHLGSGNPQGQNKK
jgi:hypothetical protein